MTMHIDETGCELLLAAIFHRARLDARRVTGQCNQATVSEAREFLAQIEADCADLVVLCKPGHRGPATDRPRGRPMDAADVEDWRGPVSRNVRGRAMAVGV